MTLESAGKDCVLCGADCAGKPRVKDPKGHYYCRACYDKAQERKGILGNDKATRAPLPLDDEHRSGLLDDLLLEAEPSATPGTPGTTATSAACPNCRANLPAGAVLCTACGYDVRAGKAVDTTTVAASTPAQATAWPTVLGVIGIVAGSLFVLSSLVNVIVGGAGVFAADIAPVSIAQFLIAVFGLLLWIWHILGSIWLIQRKQRAVGTLRSWSRVMIGLYVLSALIVLALAAMGAMASGEAGGAILFVLTMLALVAAGIVVLFWPVFLLIWFRRPKIDAETDEWE